MLELSLLENTDASRKIAYSVVGIIVERAKESESGDMNDGGDHLTA